MVPSVSMGVRGIRRAHRVKSEGAPRKSEGAPRKSEGASRKGEGAPRKAGAKPPFTRKHRNQ